MDKNELLGLGKAFLRQWINNSQSDSSQTNSDEKGNHGINRLSNNTSIVKAEPHSEEDKLLNNAQNKLMGIKLNNPTQVIQALGSLASATNDAIKYCELQKTKRTEIIAQKEIRISQINATRDAIIHYLDKTFDERRFLFKEFFKNVDKALETGNQDLLTQSLASINSLAAQSPFKDLSNMAALQNTIQTGGELDI